jgi:hypothetical protein
MEYIHERNIIHRDLKSLNILLDDSKRAKIADFGLVRMKSLAPMTGLIGTPQWMAPEILACSTYYDSKVDVFSFGIVLWELLTGEVPYKDVPVARLGYLVVQEGLRPEIPKSTPAALATLMAACWSADPRKRPDFGLIINLFNSNNYHFPGTHSDEVWRLTGRRRRSQSSSDPVNFVEPAARLRSASPAEKAVAKLKDAVTKGNTLSINSALGDLKSLCKVNNPGLHDCIDEIVEAIKAGDPAQQYLMLPTLNDLLSNPMLFESFYEVDGMEFLGGLLSSDDAAVSELALSIFVNHIAGYEVSVDSIKGFLGFVHSAEVRVREMALAGLFQIVHLQFETLRVMPSFLFYLIAFGLKPLSLALLTQLVDVSLHFLEQIISFPECILPQLVKLHDVVSPDLRPKVIQCLISATRFETARDSFPGDFWRSTRASFPLYSQLFRALVPNPPENPSDLILTLMDISAERADALAVLVDFAVHLECAKVVVTHLPIRNQTSPGPLLQLYLNISEVDGSGFLIADQPEFYTICKLVLTTKFQKDACKLLRRLPLNPILLESSGLIQDLCFLITRPNVTGSLWTLMSVVFTLSRDRYYECFTFIVPKLMDFLDGPPGDTRTGAFLCLANFLEFSSDIEARRIVLLACEFVNVEKAAVRTVCTGFLRRMVSDFPPELVKEAIQYFVACHKQPNSNAAEFAGTLLDAAAVIPDISRSSLDVLARIAESVGD